MTIRIKITGVRVQVDQHAAQQVGSQFGQRLVTDVLRRSLNRATILTPVDFGNLRAHNRIRMAVATSRVYGELFNDADYAAAVHNGRQATTIRPRRKKALKFVVNGRTVYAKKVHQKARKGRPFLSTAVREIAVPAGFTWTPL